MSLLKWFGRKSRKAQLPAARRTPMRLEVLEDRWVPAIVWDQSIPDNFGIYGAQAGQARAIVQQAIADWERVIANFNYAHVGAPGNPTQANVFTISFVAKNVPGARGEVDSVKTDSDNKPYQAVIHLDDNGGGAGWYFDARPDDNGEFVLVNSIFSGSATTASGITGSDFYTTVAHEIGHALGLSLDLLQDRVTLASAGIDQIDKSSQLHLFQGAGYQATFTAADGGHFYEGKADPNFPNVPRHTGELLNSGRGIQNNNRRLISNLDASVLRDGFGYSVNMPSETFLVNLNASTGVLNIGSEPSADGVDTVILSKSGNFIVASVDGVVSFVPASAVTQININTGFGLDFVHINGTFAHTTVFVDTGSGQDQITVGGGNLSNTPSTIFIDAGASDFDSVTIDDRFNAVKATYSLQDSTVTRAGGGIGGAQVSWIGNEKTNIQGGSNDNTFVVEDTAAGTTTSLFGGAGDDTFKIAPTKKNLDVILGEVFSHGFGGIDSLVVEDSANPTASTYSVTDTIVRRTVPASAQVSYDTMEGVTLAGGNGADLFNIESTLGGATTTVVNGGNGGDSFQVTPASGDLSKLEGLLFLGGGAGTDSVTLHDFANTVATSYSISSESVSSSRGAQVSYDAENVSLNGGSANNTFNADSFSGTSLTLQGGFGKDTFNLTPTDDNLDALGAEVSVLGSLGDDRLVMSDSANGAATTYSFSEAKLTRTKGGATSQVSFFGVEDVELSGGSASNTYHVEATPADAIVQVFAGDNNDTLHVSPIDKNLDRIDGKLHLHGMGGTDAVVINDSGNAGGASYELSTGRLTRVAPAAAEIRFFSQESTLIKAGTGADSLALVGFSPILGNITFDAGAGSDTLVATPNRDNVFDVTGINAGTVNLPAQAVSLAFLGTENLRGNVKDDTFRFRDGARIDGTVNGGGGVDTLDYSPRTTAVVVNMPAGTATATAGIADVENVFGSSATDTLTGSEFDNILLGNGGDDVIDARGGDDVVVGGTGIDRLSGGPGRNILIGGAGSDTLIGGADEDLLIGGTTAHDTSVLALQALLKEWESPAAYETRVAHLRGTLAGGLNGSVFLKSTGAGQSVFDDGAGDRLNGGAGLDWFFIAAGDTSDGVLGELVN